MAWNDNVRMNRMCVWEKKKGTCEISKINH